MVDLPPSIRSPSRYEQYWIRYVVAGVAAGYAAIFVYRCVPAAITMGLDPGTTGSMLASSVRGCAETRTHIAKARLLCVALDSEDASLNGARNREQPDAHSCSPPRAVFTQRQPLMPL